MTQAARNGHDFTRWRGFHLYCESNVGHSPREEVKLLRARVRYSEPPYRGGSTQQSVVGFVHHEKHHGANMPRKVTPPESQGCDSFQARLSAALVRRLHPFTALHFKQIPVADPESLQRWAKGEGAPSAENLCALIHFFWSAGDRAFLFEVLGIEPLALLASDIGDEIAAVLKRKGMAA